VVVSTGIVLAQVHIAAKSNEIPAFTPLPRRVPPTGITERRPARPDRHAELLAADGGHLMVAVKGNQPTLFAQLKALPWAQIPVGCQTCEIGRGRKRDPHDQSGHRGYRQRGSVVKTALTRFS
jgi:hypothetical protein